MHFKTRTYAISITLECAFSLVCDGVINVQNAVKETTEKKGKITLPKTLNKATRNMSKGISMFFMGNWSSEAQSYVIFVIKKSVENTADIITSAYALLNHGPSNSSPSDANTIDPHVLFWYFFMWSVVPKLTGNFLDIV